MTVNMQIPCICCGCRCKIIMYENPSNTGLHLPFLSHMNNLFKYVCCSFSQTPLGVAGLLLVLLFLFCCCCTSFHLSEASLTLHTLHLKNLNERNFPIVPFLLLLLLLLFNRFYTRYYKNISKQMTIHYSTCIRSDIDRFYLFYRNGGRSLLQVKQAAEEEKVHWFIM